MKRIKHARYALLAALSAILMTNLLTEQLDLSDHAAPVIRQILHTPWGKLLVAVGAPLIEELIFRLGIIGSLLRWTHLNPWTAILISATLFATAHWNPAQTPVALIIGLILGISYWRSGLWLSILIHVTNNTLALIQYHHLGDRADTYRLTDDIGGPLVAWTLILLTIPLTLWSIHRYLQETK